MKKPLIALLFMFSTFTCFSLEKNVVIDNGHLGAVNDVCYQEAGNLLFTAGDDGTFRAWDPDSRSLVFAVQASFVPIKRIALNQDRPQIAVVEQHGASSYAINVWNWRTREKLYSIPLTEAPLHIIFSPGGNLLVYSRADWNSLRLISGMTGVQEPWLTDGFGIVTTFVLSPSEKTIMTYNPSGSIQYWDIQEGKRKQIVSCVSNLASICFTQNLRYMFGYNEGMLYLINAVDGRTVFSRLTDPVLSSSMNPLNGEACFLVSKPQGQELLLIDTNSSSLQSRTIPLGTDMDYTRILYRYNSVYLTSAEGRVGIVDTRYYSKSYLNNSILVPVENIFVEENRVLVATETDIHIFTTSALDENHIRSDRFDGLPGKEKPADLHDRRFPIPFQGPASLEYINRDKYLLFSKGKISQFTFFDPDFGFMFTPTPDLDSSILSVESDGKGILVLDSSGVVHVLDPDSLASEFTYNAFGLTDAILDEGRIIAGKDRQSGFQSSLIIIDTSSGETVPLLDSNMVTYSLLKNPINGNIYSLGFENYGSETRTVLKEHDAPSLSRSTLLMSYQGEDYSAHMCLLPDTTTVYTTLGYNGISEIAGTSVRTFKVEDHVPRVITASANYLFTINTDNTVSVLDRADGTKLGELYIFRDGSWVLTFGSGGYVSSPFGEKYISGANSKNN